MYRAFISLLTIILKLYYLDLIPRPFPPPVFDHLQYTKVEVEGLGNLVTSNDDR